MSETKGDHCDPTAFKVTFRNLQPVIIKMAALGEIRILILFTVFSTFVDCQITKLPTDVDVCVGDNVDIDWVYGNEADFLTVAWTYIDSQTSTQTTIMQQTTGGNASVVNNYNVMPNTNFNGGITLTTVTKANSGSYKISVTYLTASAVDDTVTVTVKDCTDCTCECKCKCKNMVFASIAIGIAGAITLLIVVGGTVKECIGRKTALVVDSIGILCGVTSFVLGIVVQAIDCCEDCCEDSDCCECERNWVENTGAAFIAIGALVGIAGGVIFYRVWFGRMGPGNNAYKAKEAKEPGENHGMTGTSM